MNIYNHNTVPRIWKDYLKSRDQPLDDQHALLVIMNDRDGNVKKVDDWLNAQDIVRQTRYITVNGNTLIVVVNSDHAALLKLSMPL